MSKTYKIILIIIGILPLIRILKDIYSTIGRELMVLFCRHQWNYWKMHIHCTEHSGIDNTIMTKWRRCDKCQKCQKLNTLPGDWTWKKSSYDLPDDTDTIHFDVKSSVLIRRETISDKRDKKINQILG